jgi:hypothetical protein
MDLNSGKVHTDLVAPAAIQSNDDNREFGDFTYDAGKVTGADRRGVTYTGSYTQLDDGDVDVTLTASIPAGTKVADGSGHTETSHQNLDFRLDKDQLAGKKSVQLSLSGLGSAELILIVS